MTEIEEKVMIKLIMVSRNMGEFILKDSPIGQYIRELVKEAKELLLQTETGKELIEKSKGNLYSIAIKQRDDGRKRQEDINKTTGGILQEVGRENELGEGGTEESLPSSTN